MNMVLFSVHFLDDDTHVAAGLLRGFLKRSENPPGDDFSPVFRREYQVDMEQRDRAAATDKFLHTAS